MRATGLPEYAPPSLVSPTYTTLPRTHEYRLAFNHRHRGRPSRSFVKQTKNGNVSLRLADQDDQAPLPVYGLAASVQGTVDINKTEGITSVEVQVEGTLKLEEVAEAGASTHTLFSHKNMLWVKDRLQGVACPNSLRFIFPLPTTYLDGDKTYSLPPSFEAHLSGLPGFRADVAYSISVVVVKPSDVSSIVKSTLFRKDDWNISTLFLYLPRSRPSVPIPGSLVATSLNSGFMETPEWRLFSSTIPANRRGTRDVGAKLYIPSTRIFCVRQPIPFHLSFHSVANSLLDFLPFAPMASVIASKRRSTRIQLMRQTSVDVRNALVLGTKSDIWRVDCIGEGAFRDAGAGSGWVAFSGHIFISEDVTVGGFRASGFSVRDYLVLGVIPPDLSRSPFKELRMVVPVRLVTDRWSEDGAGLGLYGPPPVSSSEDLTATPELPYTP